MRNRMVLFVVLAMVLFIPLSQAAEEMPETRQEVITLEGVDETITTTYFESSRGYSMWIDTSFLSLQPEGEGNDVDVFLRPDLNRGYEVDINYAGWLGYTFEEAVESARQVLIDNYGVADAFDIEGTFIDLPACGFHAADGDASILQFIVDQGEGAYFIRVLFPQEAAEGFGSRVMQMLNSFEVLPRNENAVD